jgi:A/G-specific adenine glycosylase
MKKVLKLWQGLGYYSRAKSQNSSIRSGVRCFPDNSDLLKLKVGGIPQPRLPRFLTMKWFRCGRNVFRVLSRYFDVETDIALASAKRFAALASN